MDYCDYKANSGLDSRSYCHLFLMPIPSENDRQFWQALSRQIVSKSSSPEQAKYIQDNTELHIKSKYKKQKRREQARLLGRTLLTILLSQTMHIPEKAITIIDRSNLPPQVPILPSHIKFSISHSAGLIAVALMNDGPSEEVHTTVEPHVGVDIERHNFRRNLGMQEWVCTPFERAILNAEADMYDRYRFFYDCWTKKEASLKASYDGILSTPLNELHFFRQLEARHASIHASRVSMENGKVSLAKWDGGVDANHKDTPSYDRTDCHIDYSLALSIHSQYEYAPISVFSAQFNEQRKLLVRSINLDWRFYRACRDR